MKNPILSIAASLLVAISVQVAGSASAASASGASTSATRVKVRIHLTGTTVDLRPRPRRPTRIGRGRFTLSATTYTRVGGTLTASGAISDHGTFVDVFQCDLGPCRALARSLRGAKGTIWVRADRPKGNWIIIKGTRAYAGLRGIGRQYGLYARTIDVTMTGTLSRPDRSAASSSGALRGRVVIRCKGGTTQAGRPPLGLCTIRGAITDRGRFVDGDLLHRHPHDRILFGRKGTIRMSVYRERRGHWTIFGGTKAYAGLRGRGWESLSCRRFLGARCGTIALTMTGTVSQ